jgi:hypothetical protein
VAAASGRFRTVWLGSIHPTCLMRDQGACKPLWTREEWAQVWIRPDRA